LSNLRNILEEFRAARQAHAEILKPRNVMVDNLRNYITKFDSGLIHQTGDLISKLDVIIKSSDDEECKREAMAFRRHFVDLTDRLDTATTLLQTTRTALDTEARRLSGDQSQRVQQEADQLLKSATQALLPFCANEQEARQFAAQLSKVRAAHAKSLQWGDFDDPEVRAASLLAILETIQAL
jgi:hypothetical protein